MGKHVCLFFFWWVPKANPGDHSTQKCGYWSFPDTTGVIGIDAFVDPRSQHNVYRYVWDWKP